MPFKMDSITVEKWLSPRVLKTKIANVCNIGAENSH